MNRVFCIKYIALAIVWAGSGPGPIPAHVLCPLRTPPPLCGRSRHGVVWGGNMGESLMGIFPYRI